MKKLVNIGNKLMPIIFIVILIILWHFSVSSGFIKPYMLPLPMDVLKTLFEIFPEINEHLFATILEAIYGLLIAIVFSIVLAILMDNVKMIKKAVYPVLIISQTVPIIVLAPLFAVWFGLGMFPKVIVVALVCFFPIVVSLIEGLESVDKDLINLMKSMGATKFKIFKLVKFPASMVSFFSGLKVAATYSIMGATIGEWMGGKVGLGLYLLRVKGSFLMDKLFAVIIIIVILSMGIFKLVSLTQYILMPWNRENKKRGGKQMKKLGSYFVVLILLVGTLVGCQKPIDKEEDVDEAKEKKVEKVTFILDWLPNTNHTGVYTALEKGYFLEEGLEVEIIQPSEGDANALVGAGQGDFGVSFQEQVTMARTAKNPIPIKAIAAIVQHNTSGFAAPVEKGIKSPKDFEGKKYGSWGTELERAFLKTLMEKEGADFEKLEIFDLVSYDFFTSVKSDVDFQWIYYGWDGIAAEVKNFPIDFIKLQDVDPQLDFYTPVIITNEDIVNNKPELARKFLRAVTKGYEFAIENPEKAVEYLLKHAPETDKEIALASQKYLADEYAKDADRWGEMKLQIWESFGNWMYENGLLESKLNAKEAFTNEFLPEK